MSENIYNKLVRDKIPEVIEKAGVKHVSRKIEGQELREALVQKLVEESQEVVEAIDSKQEMQKEVGDVMEVVKAIVEVFGLDESKIEELRQKRREERGGFEEGVFLEKTER